MRDIEEDRKKWEERLSVMERDSQKAILDSQVQTQKIIVESHQSQQRSGDFATRLTWFAIGLAALQVLGAGEDSFLAKIAGYWWNYMQWWTSRG